jgi:hypothetical protein
MLQSADEGEDEPDATSTSDAIEVEAEMGIDTDEGVEDGECIDVDVSLWPRVWRKGLLQAVTKRASSRIC